MSSAVHRTMRSIIEKLSRDHIVRRSMPADLGGGPILVSPDAMLKLWRRNVERCDPDLFAAARRLIKSGMRVWDIGANVGLFTFAAQHLAGSAGHVVAVEADQWLASLLQRSHAIRRDAGAPVDIVCAAVSDALALARFNIAARGRAANALEGTGSSQMGGVRETLIVPCLTLDMILERFGRPDVIKMDIEGAEGKALAAAGSALATHPVLILEVSGTNAEMVSSLLIGLGYRLYDIGDFRAGAELARATSNIIAVPPTTHTLP